MSNERSRDFGGAKSQGADPGADRRDSGADALLELARLIGGQNDPFAPEAPKADPRRPEPRLGDVTRAAALQADPGRGSWPPPDRNAAGRREPDFSEPVDEPPRPPRAGGGFNVPEPPEDDYPRAARRVADEQDYDFDDRRGGQAYRRRRDDFADETEYGDDYGETDDFDEDEPGTRRRRPVRVVMAVLGLAVFGSVAAYGYRTFIGVDPSGPLPVIRADNSPSKIAPMTDVRADSGRTSERIGERLLRRDEDPVDVVASPDTGDGASDVVPSAPPPALPGDPKRVHTVPIRADQGTASSPDRPPPSRSASQTQGAPPAPPAAPRQQVAAVPPPVPAPAPAPPSQQRTTAVAPAASAPLDMPAAVSAEAGGFVVQVSAQRSEADAQTAFRQLQAKYPMLSGRQPLIRRKDQGERGIFFAAQVGPFGAKSDADQLCEQLKSAGGTCFVQRN